MNQLSEADLALLEKSFFFSGADEGLLAQVAQDPRCRVSVCAKGEDIFTPHTFIHALGVVLSGRVQVRKEGLLVSELTEGDLFGAAALFNQREDYAATLTARSGCRVLLLPQEMVTALMAKAPLLAANYIRYLSGRIRFLEGKLDGLLAGSAERKLAQHLLDRSGDETGSLTELAGRLGVSRASLYRALDALCATGAISREGKRIRVLDQARLEAVNE